MKKQLEELTPEQAGVLLALSPEYIRALAQRGDIMSRRRLNRLAIPLKAVRELFAQRYPIYDFPEKHVPTEE